MRAGGVVDDHQVEASIRKPIRDTHVVGKRSVFASLQFRFRMIQRIDCRRSRRPPCEDRRQRFLAPAGRARRSSASRRSRRTKTYSDRCRIPTLASKDRESFAKSNRAGTKSRLVGIGFLPQSIAHAVKRHARIRQPIGDRHKHGSFDYDLRETISPINPKHSAIQASYTVGRLDSRATQSGNS